MSHAESVTQKTGRHDQVQTRNSDSLASINKVESETRTDTNLLRKCIASDDIPNHAYPRTNLNLRANKSRDLLQGQAHTNADSMSGSRECHESRCENRNESIQPALCRHERTIGIVRA